MAADHIEHQQHLFKMGTECRAFGIIPNQNLNTLASVLRGLCFKYAGLHQYEVVMKVPLMAGISSSSIKLSRRMNKADASLQSNPFMEKQPDRQDSKNYAAHAHADMGILEHVLCSKWSMSRFVLLSER